jgi:hypothetical protein
LVQERADLQLDRPGSLSADNLLCQTHRKVVTENHGSQEDSRVTLLRREHSDFLYPGRK